MIYALITLYNPTDSVAENVKSVILQADKVFLCDNSSRDNRSLFSELVDGSKNTDDTVKVEYIPYLENLGLAGAFNHVLKNTSYHFNDNDYLIFFDQDSNIKEGHIQGLIEQFQKMLDKKLDPGCLGPVYFNKSNGTVEVPHDKTVLFETESNSKVQHVWTVKSIITSSMLTTYGRLKEIDFFNESIFLDFVDWDVCWRFMAKDFLCCMTDAVTLIHAVGEGDKKIGFSRLRVGAAFRVYYQTRDSLYLLRKKYVPMKFRVRLIIRITIEAIVHVLFLNNKKQRIYFYFKGIRDYVHGVHGVLKC